jgi:hypothetical protein
MQRAIIVIGVPAGWLFVNWAWDYVVAFAFILFLAAHFIIPIVVAVAFIIWLMDVTSRL